MLRQRIAQSDRAIGGHAGQYRAGEDLAYRTDAHQRVPVGRLAGTRLELAEPRNGGLTTAHRADDEPRHPGFQEKHGAGEFHRFGQKVVSGGNGAAGKACQGQHGGGNDRAAAA